MTVDTEEGARRAARKIAGLGPRAVLVKGGHGAGDRIVDVLWTGRRFRVFESRRIATAATHGTGCVLSSAIAANLALGLGVEGAVEARDPILARGAAPRLLPGRRVPEWRDIGSAPVEEGSDRFDSDEEGSDPLHPPHIRREHRGWI